MSTLTINSDLPLDFAVLFDLQFLESRLFVNEQESMFIKLPDRIQKLLKTYEGEFIRAVRALQFDMDLPLVKSTGNIPAPSRADYMFNAFKYLPKNFHGMTYFELGVSQMPHVMAAAIESGRFDIVGGAEYFPNLANAAYTRLKSAYPDFGTRPKGNIVNLDFMKTRFGVINTENCLFSYFPSDRTDLSKVISWIQPDQILIYSPGDDIVEDTMIELGYVPSMQFRFVQSLVREDQKRKYANRIPVCREMLLNPTADLNLTIGLYLSTH